MRVLTKSPSERGSSLIEFSLVVVQLCLVLFAIFEIARMVLVSTTVAHSARTAVRYAIVHGSSRTGSGVDGQSGPGNTTEVTANIVKYAKTGLLNTTRLSTTVAYPDGNNTPGSRVIVTVVYPYDPFTFLPFRFRLGSTTEGIICF